MPKRQNCHLQLRNCSQKKKIMVFFDFVDSFRFDRSRSIGWKNEVLYECEKMLLVTVGRYE